MQVHAELIVAPSLSLELLPDDIRTPSPDVQHIVVDRFGIDDARRLTLAAATRAVTAPSRAFAVACSVMTSEAQNALLKLFEDPPQQVRFAVMVPHESLIMPTLRSRFVTVVSHDASAAESSADAFLAMSYAERIAHIASLHTAKRTAEMELLARDVGAALIAAPADADALAAASFVEQRIRITGGSRKMLLEHLALAVPESK